MQKITWLTKQKKLECKSLNYVSTSKQSLKKLFKLVNFLSNSKQNLKKYTPHHALPNMFVSFWQVIYYEAQKMHHHHPKI